MTNYQKAKFYYENGNWTIEKLLLLVENNYITDDEYKSIVGDE